ncbi:MAG: branched-chain amino acid ABC transporter permease, partial [Mycolicibacterium hassiacum]
MISSAQYLAQDSEPWINTDTFINLFWANTIGGLEYGSIYALVALGYTLVYGVLKLLNFAHSEVFIYGAYATWFTFFLLGFRPGPTPELPVGELIAYLVLAVIVAMLVSGTTALVLERVAYRPLRNRGAPRLAFLITAIGASLILQQILFLWRGSNPEQAIRLLRPETLFNVGSASVQNLTVIIVVASVLMWIWAETFVNRTRF